MASEEFHEDQKVKHQDINILLLGESGVGKSTFINSIANYLHFQSFEEAEKSEELLALTPTIFTVPDDNFKTLNIEVEPNSNESQGLETTEIQNVRTYVVPIGDGKTRLRLIDSPEVGDFKNIEQDMNLENIVAYLSQLKELHAICFLFKPTETRLTVEYGMKQLLSWLGKCVTKNIIFVFTHTKDIFYTPGDTAHCLQTVIDDIKTELPNVEIPFKNNVFSVDNLAFKYLSATNKGHSDVQNMEELIESWNHSGETCRNFISYIMGDASQDPLKPYQLLNTISIHKARTNILQLTQPLIDISQLICDNLQVLNTHMLHLKDENQSLEQLKDTLYIPIIDLDLTQLDQPVTICTSKSCANIVEVGEEQTRHYRQICHDSCCNMTKQMIGNSNLLECTALEGTRSCEDCKCNYSIHIHVFYLTKTVEDKVVDNAVKDNITNKEEAVREGARLIEEMDRKKTDLEQERHAIVRSMAQFSHFLQYNAVSPFNDSYEVYIEYLIAMEKSREQDADQKLITNLEQLLRQHEEMKLLFEENLEFNQESGLHTSTVTAKTVVDTIEQLFQLQHNGKKIQELFRKGNALGICKINECVDSKSEDRETTDCEKKNKNKKDGESTGEEGNCNIDGQSLSDKESFASYVDHLNGETTGDVKNDDDKKESKEEQAVETSQYFNVLLLGETGVGKSTFINSIANYLHFKSFKEAAEADKMQILIPTIFTVTDENYEQIKISLGSDENEHQKAGAAGTQDVKTYMFDIDEGRSKLRLIDSPGIGDPRGIEQDDLNCENILSYLSHLKELHAICFLFKPTNTRLTVLFEYCMKQLLSRLEKSASKNIIFIFTNTRATFYTPGDTMPCLKAVINDIKAKPPFVEISLKGNVFCLDNEAFKYLLAMREGYKFTPNVQKLLIESWNYSVDECRRLISYIVGDASQASLKPHQLMNTISINKARTTIGQLSQPLADISQHIDHHILILDRHRLDLENNDQSLKELKKNLYMPMISLEVAELTRPVTVCTSKKCADIVKIGEVQKWHYRQRCHEPCDLTNVTKELIGDPNLLGCTAMGGTRNCRMCKCDYSVHMHVYYMSTTVESKVVDNAVRNNITKKKEALRECERLITEMDRLKADLEQERDVITRSMAQFAHFLQYNAISPFNDSYKAYIEYLITREKSLGQDASQKIITNLEKLLRQYEEMKVAFERSLEFNQESGMHTSTVTAQNVVDTIEQLYHLKHNGKKIQELFDKQNTARKWEYYSSCVTWTVTQKNKNAKKNKFQEDRKKNSHDERSHKTDGEASLNSGFSAHTQQSSSYQSRYSYNMDNRPTYDKSNMNKKEGSSNLLSKGISFVKKTISLFQNVQEGEEFKQTPKHEASKQLNYGFSNQPPPYDAQASGVYNTSKYFETYNQSPDPFYIEPQSPYYEQYSDVPDSLYPGSGRNRNYGPSGGSHQDPWRSQYYDPQNQNYGSQQRQYQPGSNQEQFGLSNPSGSRGRQNYNKESGASFDEPENEPSKGKRRGYSSYSDFK